MYYTYDQYLAYRKAKNAVDAFKAVQPTEPIPITFTHPVTREQVVFDGLTEIPEEAYELYREWEGDVAPCKHPIVGMPNFYQFVKHDVPQDIYNTRAKEITSKGGNPELLTPSELHYLQTGDWNV